MDSARKGNSLLLDGLSTVYFTTIFWVLTSLPPTRNHDGIGKNVLSLHKASGLGQALGTGPQEVGAGGQPAQIEVEGGGIYLATGDEGTAQTEYLVGGDGFGARRGCSRPRHKRR